MWILIGSITAVSVLIFAVSTCFMASQSTDSRDEEKGLLLNKIMLGYGKDTEEILTIASDSRMTNPTMYNGESINNSLKTRSYWEKKETPFLRLCCCCSAEEKNDQESSLPALNNIALVPDIQQNGHDIIECANSKWSYYRYA
jgi:hypothetical protein